LAALIRQMADRHGIAVVVVEHDMALILNTCDRVVVLDYGRKIADASPHDVQRDESVIRAYLGEPIDAEAMHESVAHEGGRREAIAEG
jgi:branched-chain amino acid transport system ATP-binding protein